MARRRKFRRGEPIATLEQLASLYKAQAWIYFSNKPLHFGWWGSWSIHLCSYFVRQKYLYVALNNTTEEQPNEQ